MANYEFTDELINRLSSLRHELSNIGHSKEAMFGIVARLKMILASVFKEDSSQVGDLNSLRISEVESQGQFDNAKVLIRSVITGAIEKLQIQKLESGRIDSNSSELSKQEVLNERNKIEIQAREIEAIKKQIENERDQLLREKENFDEFKSKLEFANKRIDFQFVADKNRTDSRIWLLLSTAAFIGIILYVLNLDLSIGSLNEPFKNAMGKIGVNDIQSVIGLYKIQLFKEALAHLLVLSMMLTFLIFCVKNYNARMHNYIINLHKSNTLKSTLSLLNTAKSSDGNDQLLVQACQAIFSHQKTGYSGKDGDVLTPNFISNFFDKASK